MYVYRIEHKEIGIGPYRQLSKINMIDLDQYDMLDAHVNYTHPSVLVDVWTLPKIDSKPKPYTLDDYVCGFDTIEQLMSWFESCWLPILHTNGYVLTIYDVSDSLVVAGKHQIVFVKSQAVLIDSMSLLDILTFYS